MLKNGGGRGENNLCFSVAEDFGERAALNSQKEAGTRLGNYFHGSLCNKKKKKTNCRRQFPGIEWMQIPENSFSVVQ